ncbi:MAG TPA: zinc-binding dehydrogenase [Candidatus Saccharimonadales bacterium]|nr:zinc-binding dehydrogenase [Candidatus Saccharimonadales bacterium]
MASTGFSASEKTGLGEAVAIVAQGPIGIRASMDARLKGAGLVIGVDSVPSRMEVAPRVGADLTLNLEAVDTVAEIRRLTQGHGVDVAIEALGTPGTFRNGLNVLRPGGTLVSLELYLHGLTSPPSNCVGGLGDQSIAATLCQKAVSGWRR